MSDVSIHAFRGEGDAGPVRQGERRAGFNPRLPGGRRRSAATWAHVKYAFQSTPSGGKATSAAPAASASQSSFNPRLPGGRRLGLSIPNAGARLGFNPRLPGGRRRVIPTSAYSPRGFNPRLPGGRRQRAADPRRRRWYVSIHAFRGEGDLSRGSTR